MVKPNIVLEKLPAGMECVGGVTIRALRGEIRMLMSPDRPAAFIRRFGSFGAIVFEKPSIVPTPLSMTAVTDIGADIDWEPIGATEADRPPWRVLAEVEERSICAAPNDVQRRAAEYFRGLEVGTHRQIHDERRGSDMSGRMLVRYADEVGRVMYRRVASRRETPCRKPIDALALKPLNDLLVHHLARYFPGIPGQTALGRAAEAHVLFGAAEFFLHVIGDVKLICRTSNGGPDSPYMFAFAEFALAAIDCGCDADLWKGLAPSLVAACEAYLLCYGDIECGNIRPRHDLHYKHPPSRRLRPEHLTALLRRYDGMLPRDLDARLTQLVRCGISSFTPDAEFMTHGVEKEDLDHSSATFEPLAYVERGTLCCE